MSRIRSLFAGAAIVAGSSAALLTGGIANAEPAPPPPAPAAPAVPGMDMLQQFVANPGGALQAASSLLSTFPSLGTAATPAVPAATPPLAQASVAVPSTGVLPTATLPGMPATPAAAPVASAIPSALSVPGIPGVPLPAGVSLPPNVTSLLPSGIPTLGNSTTVPGVVAPITPAAPVAPTAGLGNMFPVSALP